MSLLMCENLLQGSGSSEGDSDVAERLNNRTRMVQKHFADALSADDFLARVEVALAAYGFRGDNSLALTNVCRDESTGILKEKIDEIFGQCFNINGLGGVLTCGVTGASLSKWGTCVRWQSFIDHNTASACRSC